jgi:hypothetical protein
MATKNWAGDFLDPALNTIKAYAKKLILCSDEPTTYTAAMDTYALARADLVSGDFSGPTNGSSSGRKITIAQKDGVTVLATGTARYLALVDTTTLKLRYVGQIPDYPVTAQTVISIAPTSIEIADPF